MKKIIYLLLLVPTALSSCNGNMPSITKEKALEIANKMVEKQRVITFSLPENFFFGNKQRKKFENFEKVKGKEFNDTVTYYRLNYNRKDLSLCFYKEEKSNTTSKEYYEYYFYKKDENKMYNLLCRDEYKFRREEGVLNAEDALRRFNEHFAELGYQKDMTYKHLEYFEKDYIDKYDGYETYAKDRNDCSFKRHYGSKDENSLEFIADVSLSFNDPNIKRVQKENVNFQYENNLPVSFISSSSIKDSTDNGYNWILQEEFNELKINKSIIEIPNIEDFPKNI